MQITERALFTRMKRRLAHDGLILRRCRKTSNGYLDLGDVYVTDESQWLKDAHVDLETRAKEMGILRPGETVAAAA